jgi:hypothetical protein
MKARCTKHASVQPIQDGWRLGIEAGDANTYRDAQLDDYFGLPRSRFPHRPSTPLRLSLCARTSTRSAAGTWGFGLWNDPFGLSLGFGGSPFRLPALPNAAWFFYASPENYLSFKGGLGTGEKSVRPTRPPAVNGFMAQTFRSPMFHPLLIPAGLALPFSRKATRKLLSKIVVEDSSTLSVDTTQWHSYRLEWSAKRVAWDVDEVRVFESPVSPNALRPLGLIIWIDNQYAAFTPEGRISFGVLESGEEWLEVKDIVMRNEK